MSKTKSSGKFHYELLYIVPNKFTQEEAKEVDNKVREGLAENEADITYSEEWGNKKMAYPINHYTHGYYYLIEFDMPGEKVNQMNYWLRMYENVVRFQVVKKRKRSQEEIEEEKRRAQEKEQAKEEEASEKESSQQASEEKKEEVSQESTQESTEGKKEEKKGEEKKEESKGKDNKKDLGDLNKNLDDILDSHDLL